MNKFPIPYSDPVAQFSDWAETPWAMLLDSARPSADHRFTYLAVEPFRTLLADADSVLVDGAPVSGDPFQVLERELKAHEFRPAADMPAPFSGGAIGLLGYELGSRLERAPSRHVASVGQPQMAIGFYDVVAVFDHLARKAWVVAAREEAMDRAQALAGRLASSPAPSGPAPQPVRLGWRAELDRDDYLERVRRLIAYIEAGDIFQANFTSRFVAKRPPGLDKFALWRRLRAANPAPFAAFLNCGPHLTVAGASPERFLSLSEDGKIQARPIKGTHPRAPEPEADRAAAAKLVASAKDQAENLMIADLLRNDIGRVAEIGSVRVPVLAGLESFASLHHLVSVVEARLRPGLGPVDLLKASFPGGSITGAPKVRAMEIIDELEPFGRGAYCGAVVWIGFNGAMDSSIVIRTLVLTDDQVITQAGGGIVADSDPVAEYEEMMAKAEPALRVMSGEST